MDECNKANRLDLGVNDATSRNDDRKDSADKAITPTEATCTDIVAGTKQNSNEASAELSNRAESNSDGRHESLPDAAEREASEDHALIDQYVDELQRQLEWRAELRRLNSCVDERRDEKPAGRLDSSLKRNTAFVRRLRCFGEPQTDAVLRDLETLNLAKYVSEAAAAIVDAKLKMSDVAAVVLVCSRLHQLYAEFGPHLLTNWQRALMPPSSPQTFSVQQQSATITSAATNSTTSVASAAAISGGIAASPTTVSSTNTAGSQRAVINAAKLRVDLRIYAELVSVRVLPRREGLQLLGAALTALTQLDRYEHRYTAVLATFCRFCGEEYAGLTSRRIREAAARRQQRSLPVSQTIASEKQRNVRQLFVDYLAGLRRHLLAEHQQLLAARRGARQQLRARGHVCGERTQQLQQLESTCERLMAADQQLRELLDEPPAPQLPEDSEEQAERQQIAAAVEQGVLTDVESADGSGQSCWEDDEQRGFYTNLSDLRAALPSILYSDSQSSAPAQPDESRLPDQMADIVQGDEDTDDSSPPPPSLSASAPDQDTTSTCNSSSTNAGAAGRQQMMEAFVTSLSTLVGRELVDEAAVHFCQRLNTRANRRRLVQALLSTPRHRLDLVPFHARLVATLHPCMPDVAAELAAGLRAEFQWHVRKKDQVNIESKLKVMRFIGELVKFGVYGRNEALWCVRQLLNAFTHHHIDMACTLLESCGRFLYCTAQSHVLTKQYVEQIVRRRVAVPMDGRHISLIDNMYYTVVPATNTANTPQKRQLPPMMRYVRHLVADRLDRSSVAFVVRQLRKLDWHDCELAEFALVTLSDACNVRYSAVRSLACVIASLARYHPTVGVRVVDNVLEDVRLGMEADDAGDSAQLKQRRVASVRYLAELYSYRLLDTPALWRVMYSLLALSSAADDDPQDYSDDEDTGDYDDDDHDVDERRQEIGDSDGAVCEGGQQALKDRCMTARLTAVADQASTSGVPEETRLHLSLLLLEFCGGYLSGGGELQQYTAVLQCYYWRRRSACRRVGLTFPSVRLQQRYSDVLRSVRPRVPLYSSRRHAERAVSSLHEKLLQKVAPALRRNMSQVTSAPRGDLPSIAEEREDQRERRDHDEQFEEEEEGVMSSEDVEDASEEHPDRQRDEQEQGEDEEEDDWSRHETDSGDEHESGERGITEQNADVRAPRLIACAEDDDFQAAFDRLIHDSLTERGRESSAAAVRLELSAPPPVSLSTAPAAANLHQQQQTSEVHDEQDHVNVTVMLRRGAKPTHRRVAVPTDADLAVCLRSRAEAERRERQHVKQLTLDFNERQEAEQQQQQLLTDASVVFAGYSGGGGGGGIDSPTRQCNLNRERRSRYHPGRGAPDADLIFGPKRVSHR